MGETLRKKAERLVEYRCEHEGPHLTISCLREDAAEVAKAYLELLEHEQAVVKAWADFMARVDSASAAALPLARKIMRDAQTDGGEDG